MVAGGPLATLAAALRAIEVALGGASVTVRIITADVMDGLRQLRDESVHCVVTSPPYWGLRDYGIPPSIWGGDPGCPHEWGADIVDETLAKRGVTRGTIDGGDTQRVNGRFVKRSALCTRCGAWRGALGLEPTHELFIANIRTVFAEVYRVLRSDGTLWLNMGDSYAGSYGAQSREHAGKHAPNVSAQRANQVKAAMRRTMTGSAERTPGLKPKDLIGMPWRVAFALQADGWWLRSDNIWAKPNPMPESVTDRPTRAHEYVFLLSKSERYFYDAAAIAEPASYGAPNSPDAIKSPYGQGFSRRASDKQGATGGALPARRRGHARLHQGFNERWDAMEREQQCAGTRNKRSVWAIAAKPFPEAHFATFPPELPEVCIKAGTSQHGCCVKCGAPWARDFEKELVPTAKAAKTFVVDARDRGADTNDQGANRQKDGHRPGWSNKVTTLGWKPLCECNADIIPATVLDPFSGAGTTGLVADRLQCHAILIELNPDYAAMAHRRIHGDAPLLAEVNS
jgi:DNA modification methylase